MFWILTVFISIFVLATIIGYTISGPVYSGNKSDHFDGNKFTNLSGAKAKGFSDVLKWMVKRDQGAWEKIDTLKNIAAPPKEVNGESVRITFVNHSTFLIQIDGTNILTDPIWSERTSPVSFAGPKRMTPPGIKFKDLPPIDAVIISHNHYDHLDVPTIKRLEKAHSPHFYVPLGITKFLKNKGIQRSTDMDWWHSMPLAERIKLHCVPAQHFSGRGTFDRDKTLWCGFVLDTPSGNIYFAGDSGYGDFFKEIGEQLGPFKISFIPIGAYKPKWFMSPIHISPTEAIQVHRDVQSRRSIAMHFGTFPLGDDGMNEPVDKLKKALKKEDVPEAKFIIMDPGMSETFKF